MTDKINRWNPSGHAAPFAPAERTRRRREPFQGAGSDHRALYWMGILDRKYVKQPTMTTPYGVRGVGIRQQLMTAMLERHPELFRESRSRWTAANYLAPILERAIAGVVVKAAEIMDWLRKVVQALAKRGRVASWTTPTGFPVINKYAKLVVKRIETIAATMTLRVPDPKGRLDGPKQMDSIVPNLVHSLDAAHMMLPVRELREQGQKTSPWSTIATLSTRRTSTS